MCKDEEIRRKRKELQAYIDDGIARVDSGELVGSHLLGVATSAVSRFEVLLRRLLEQYLAFCGIDYEESVSCWVDGKPFNLLTLGQVILVFRRLEEQLAVCHHTRFGVSSQHGVKNKVIDKNLSKWFDQITQIRKKLHDDKPMLPAEARSLLLAIGRVLNHALFSLAEQDQ